jgi:hypothetical protein
MNRPATTYANSTISGVPTLQIMTRALRNTPVPIAFVTVKATAIMRPMPFSRRGASLALLGIAKVNLRIDRHDKSEKSEDTHDQVQEATAVLTFSSGGLSFCFCCIRWKDISSKIFHLPLVRFAK